MKHNLHVCALLLAALFLSFLSPHNAAAEGLDGSIKWRSVGSDVLSPSSWNEGNFANLGFTTDTLEFEVQAPPPSDEPVYLILAPVYIDQINVLIADENGNQHFELGDKQAPIDHSSVLRLPGKVAIALAGGTSKISVHASSTSNLRLSLAFETESALNRHQGQLVFGATLLLTLITLSWVLALVSWQLNRSRALLYFASYQLSWTLLLSGIFFPVFPADLWSASTNHLLVSLGAILATLTGALTHAQILSEFAAARGPATVLRAVALIAAALLALYFAGYELLALKLNILIVSFVPVLIILMILFVKPGPEHRNMWGKIRLGYILLMGTVVLTGVSGLGVGKLFDITYVHALITTLLLSTLLILGIRDNNAKIRAQLQRIELEAAQKALIETQLNENIAMFEMLSHEIKTPLTTLSMMLHKASNRERAGRQIDAIRTIIEQTGMALNLPSAKIETDRISLQRAVMGNWQLLSAQSEGRSLDVKLSNNFWIAADSYLLDILLRNVLKNAIKYSAPLVPIRVYTLNRDHRLVLIISNVSRIKYSDSSNLFEKYWRADESKSVRGSGLGLWLVKRIAEISNFEVNAVVKRNRFRIVLSISNYGEFQ